MFELKLTIDFPALSELARALASRSVTISPPALRASAAELHVTPAPAPAPAPAPKKRGRLSAAEIEAREAREAASSGGLLDEAEPAPTPAPAPEPDPAPASVESDDEGPPASPEVHAAVVEQLKENLRKEVARVGLDPAPPTLRVVPPVEPDPKDLSIPAIRQRFVAIVHKAPVQRDKIVALLQRVGLKTLDEAKTEHLRQLAIELPVLEREAREIADEELTRKADAMRAREAAAAEAEAKLVAAEQARGKK